MFRDMRRFKQKLTNEECEAILRGEKRGTLAVLGDGDYPYAVPLDFVYSEGCVYFHSAVEGHKLDALRKHDKGSFCVISENGLSADGWSYYVNSVIVFGRLREITDNTEKYRALRLLGEKYFPTAEMVEGEIEKDERRCTVIELRSEHMSGKRVHER